MRRGARQGGLKMKKIIMWSWAGRYGLKNLHVELNPPPIAIPSRMGLVCLYLCVYLLYLEF